MDGVVNVDPVAIGVPPDADEYQLIVPPEQPEAVKVTVPGPHLEAFTTSGGSVLQAPTKYGQCAVW